MEFHSRNVFNLEIMNDNDNGNNTNTNESKESENVIA